MKESKPTQKRVQYLKPKALRLSGRKAQSGAKPRQMGECSSGGWGDPPKCSGGGWP